MLLLLLFSKGCFAVEGVGVCAWVCPVEPATWLCGVKKHAGTTSLVMAVHDSDAMRGGSRFNIVRPFP